MIARRLQSWLAYPRSLPTLRDAKAAFLGGMALIAYANAQAFALKWHEQATRPAPVVVRPIPRMCVFPRAREKRGYEYLA